MSPATLAPASAWPQLTDSFSRERIRAYAEAGGDMNPIHVDNDFALSVGLPGVIAHGLLTMAGLARALTSQLDEPDQLLELETRFSGMVFPDQPVTYSGEVVGVQDGQAEVDLWAEDQEGRRVLSRARAVVALNPPAR
ncbi:MAG: MaoC/PaaZ C-terminal domain-containing protein [Candidatus Dormibacteria bacterium]